MPNKTSSNVGSVGADVVLVWPGAVILTGSTLYRNQENVLCGDLSKKKVRL